MLTSLRVSTLTTDVRDSREPVLVATLADGTALPSWIQFDPQTKTFSATQIPPDMKSIKIMLRSKQGQEVIAESIMTLSTN